MKTTIHRRIEEIILAAVNSIPHTSPIEVREDVFALPEELDVSELALAPSLLRLAVNNNVAPEGGYTANGYGLLVLARKPYANYSFRERGVASSVSLPWATKPGSTDFVSVPNLRPIHGYWNAFPTATEMGENMSALHRNYTLREPDKTSHCSVKVDLKPWDCPFTGGTGSFGRPIATINTLLKGYGLPLLDTLAGNEMLAKISTYLNGERVVVSWLDDPISELYSNETGRQTYPSCMKGCDANYFELYDDLQSAGRLRMLLVHKSSNTDSGDHIGRALVWCGQNPDDLYLDRIYCPTSPTSSDPRPDIVEAIANFCKAEGIAKAVFDQTSRLIPALSLTALRVRCNNYEYDAYPYVDSLRYLYHDGWISTSSARGEYHLILNQTDGRHEDQDEQEDLVVCACGNQYPESETRYSDARREHYHEDEVSWVDTANSFIPDDDIVRINRTAYDRERDDVVELHDGDYALYEDVVELHDGSYALIDDTNELHDGSYALTSDTVLLHDGAYALLEDAVEITDGYFVLREDDHENEDGTWSVNP